MKKIILSIFIICGLQLPSLAATYNCQVQEISNFSFKRSNEFLFPTYGDYNDANGRALVCGHRGTNGCDSGAMVLINGEHYWRNRRYEGMNVYVCSTGGANAWASNNKDYIQVCSNTSGKTKVGTDGRFDYYCTNVVNSYVNNWYCVGQNGTDICRVDDSKICSPKSTKFRTLNVGLAYEGVTKQECTDSGAKILDPKGLEFEMLCRPGPTLVCKATKCPNEYTPNRSTGKCDPTDNNNNGGGGGGTGTNSCEQTRCGGLSGSKYNECVACCHVASSVANWNGNSCVCAQFPDQMKFIPNTNPKTGGVCLKSNDGLSEEDKDKLLEPIELYECDPAKIAQVFTWQTQYANNSQISAQITAILQYCDDIHRTELQFNSMYNQLQILINNANDAAELNQRQTSSRRNIERAMSDIDSIRSTLDQSKWKNADGGFNTSRLLSDSIAGVVLGTASGLIVSHVVKKNQVENGFEDIQCTVGGQVVASWGDEFQVGIQ